MKTKKMFPIYVDLQDKVIVVIGGGNIAQRRVKSLIDFADNIKVISPKITPELETLLLEGKITWEKKNYEEADILGADIVLGATNSDEINNKIYSDGKKNGIAVNICSDQNKCDFHFPGIIQYEDLVIGFNSSGKDHKKTKEVREKVQNFLEGKN